MRAPIRLSIVSNSLFNEFTILRKSVYYGMPVNEHSKPSKRCESRLDCLRRKKSSSALSKESYRFLLDYRNTLHSTKIRHINHPLYYLSNTPFRLRRICPSIPPTLILLRNCCSHEVDNPIPRVRRQVLFMIVIDRRGN